MPAFSTATSSGRPSSTVAFHRRLDGVVVGQVGAHREGVDVEAAQFLGDLIGAGAAAGHHEVVPRRASSRAISRPMPLEAPVTSASGRVEGAVATGSPLRRWRERYAVPVTELHERAAGCGGGGVTTRASEQSM